MAESNRTVIIPLSGPDESVHSLLQATAEKYQYCRSRTRDYCWQNPLVPDDLVTSKQDAESALYDQLRAETDNLHANLVQKAIKDVTSCCDTLKTQWQKGERISKPEWDVGESWSLTYDMRAATFFEDAVSLATVDGRIELSYHLPSHPDETPYEEYVLSDDWEFTTSQLVYRRGNYWLHLGLKRSVPDQHWTARSDEEVSDTPSEDTSRVLGVDLNVTGYTAVTSAGGFHGNADHLNHRRSQYEALRKELQQTATESAYQRLQARRGTESDWFDEYAHCVVNGIVEDALETRVTHVVFEDLEGIRDRISDDPEYQQWMFERVQEYTRYKLEPYGVAVETVDPRNTSKQCSHTDCQHVSDRNRSGKEFECASCGRSWNADYNAARNIGLRYVEESVPSSQTRSTGKATRQLALMSGIYALDAGYSSTAWMATGKPTTLLVGS